MIRVSLSLGRITPQLSAKFSIVYESDPVDGSKKRTKEKALTIFDLGGKNISFSPNPYVTLKFTDRNLRDKNIDTGRFDKSYDASKSPTLNRQSTYQLIMLLKRFRSNIVKNEDKCFSYFDDHIVLSDTTKRGDYTMTETLKNGKTFIITPAVITEGDDLEGYEYQGCTMACNSLENYVEFTFDELEYFIYQLSEINFNQLSLMLTMYGKMLENASIDKNVQEIQERLPSKISMEKISEEEISKMEAEQIAQKEKQPNSIQLRNSDMDVIDEFDF